MCLLGRLTARGVWTGVAHEVGGIARSAYRPKGTFSERTESIMFK